MKESTISLKKYLMSGLRPSENLSRGTENLLLSTGAVPDSGSLVQPITESFVDLSSLGCSFPYPQMFVLSGLTLVCTPTSIYTYESGVLTLQLSGLTANLPWTVADFTTYLFMVNGTETVIYSPSSGSFVAIVSQELPTGQCVLGTGSQILWGGPNLVALDMGIVPRVDPLPGALDSISSTYNGTTLSVSWTLLHVPTDLKGYQPRYGVGTGLLYNQMSDLSSLVAPGTYSASKNLTLSGLYTVAVVAKDLANQESIPIYKECVYLSTNFKALGWPGTLTDCVIVEGSIEAIPDSTTWATLPATWATWTSWKTAGSGTIVYEPPAVDIGSVCSWTPAASVTCADTATITYATSVDGITYTSWAAAARVTARYCKVKISVVGAAIPKITAASLVLNSD